MYQLSTIRSYEEEKRKRGVVIVLSVEHDVGRVEAHALLVERQTPTRLGFDVLVLVHKGGYTIGQTLNAESLTTLPLYVQGPDEDLVETAGNGQNLRQEVAR